MSTIDTEKLRYEIESKFAEGKKLLEAQMASLKKWRDDKIAALDVIEGKTSADEWLSMPMIRQHANGSVKNSDCRQGLVWACGAKDLPSVNQAEEVRAAVSALRGPFTTTHVRDWLDENKPRVSKLVSQRSIRTELWRLEQKLGQLEKIGSDGNSNIYEKVSKYWPETPKG